MRWLFVDPDDQREVAQRECLVRRIGRWWDAFAARQSDLKSFFAGGGHWDLTSWMQDSLQSIDPNLMWEFGPAVHAAGHRLVITPETKRSLRPLVNRILSQAPTLEGWEFYGHRQPEQLFDVVETVRGLCGGDVSQTMVHARHDGHRRIALTYYATECSRGSDQQQVDLAAYVATESFLGEAMLDRWIGTIEVQPLARDKPRGECSRAIPFERLQPTVEAIVGSLVDQLPEEPSYRFVPHGGWNSYELQPQADTDYPRRDDLCVAISGRPDVFETLHGGSAFYSDTHSRCGETFCYLKIDGQGEPMSVRAQLREQIESAVDQLLISHQLGCVVGGGTGLRYTYIDLALLDVPAAACHLRHLGQRGLFTSRSWLLFCDDELSAEWLPLVPGAAEPPGIDT